MFKSGLLLLVATTFVGCGSSGSTSGFPNESYLRISPAEFDLPCASGSDAGAPGLVTYVATLERVTRGNDGHLDYTPISTSRPTSCSSAVRFSADVFDANADGSGFSHLYAAALLGFDRAGLKPSPDDDTEFVASGETLAPRWTGSCARARSEQDAGVDVWGGDAGLNASTTRFFNRFVEPQPPIRGRTVDLRGCHLMPVQ
jgi:hypothetical protein